ncbi:TetR/AcrR family transcriptional regulator [Cognatishimia activa]|uniref:TetR/AcrR family transcriptional regulator n=1 Tax=Cognatishimia activa TaxID=1715691 RepID=UPI002230A7E7|nr:TetR/AcrR family transcriptional regulator [Cognatishimia activa]UZD92413.1 TetR/AcrR family transcriptional regulator [Cognatishimia activa]
MSAPINPRKEPKQARSKATFEAILEASARILETGGLENFNTNRVAEVAGVSIGTLYQYFPSKQAILTEIIRQKRSLLLSDLRSATAMQAEERFEITLDKLLWAAIRHQLRWPKLAQTLEYAEAFLPLETETSELNRDILNVVSDFLIHTQHPNPEQTAQDLIAALRGMIDAAGLAGETDQQSLFMRCQKLALGYLT